MVGADLAVDHHADSKYIADSDDGVIIVVYCVWVLARVGPNNYKNSYML